MTEYLQRRRFFKKNAKKLIYADWLSQIFVFAVLFVSFAGLNSIYSGIVTLCLDITKNSLVSFLLSVLYVFLTFVFMIPLLYGTIHFEILAFEEKKPMVSNVFDAFSGTSILVRTYKTFLSFLIRVIPEFLVVFLLSKFIGSDIYYELFRMDFMVGNIDVVYLSFNVVLLVFVFLAFAFSGKHLVGLFFAVKNEDMPVGQCFKMARNACFGFTTELFLMMFSFVPLIVVSLFTMGVGFIIYTIPYLLLTFAGMSKFLYMKKISLDDERIG